MSIDKDLRIAYLVKEWRITSSEVIRRGIELYLLEELESIKLFRQILNKRLRQPINRSFLNQLKIIYYMIGNYIEEIEEKKIEPLDLKRNKVYDNPLPVNVQPPYDLFLFNTETD